MSEQLVQGSTLWGMLQAQGVVAILADLPMGLVPTPALGGSDAGAPGPLAHAHTIVRVHKRGPGEVETEQWWFVAPTGITSLTQASGSAYAALPVARVGALVEALASLLPLSTVPEPAHIVASYITSDVLDLLAMRDSVERLPAQLVLQSGGLDPEAAREFFDDLVAPVWRAAVNLIGVRNGQAACVRNLFLIQGEDGWIVHRQTEDQNLVILENALAQSVHRLISDDLAAIQDA